MFFKRDPARKLAKEYQDKMRAAMLALRAGDVRQNAQLVAEAEQIKATLDEMNHGAGG